MKANELMVGDWVKLNYDINFKTGESLYTNVRISGINEDGTIDINCTVDKSKPMQDGWDLKLIEPIPLTEEILHKNAFKNDFIAQKSIIAEGASNLSVILFSEDNRITINNIDEYLSKITLQQPRI